MKRLIKSICSYPSASLNWLGIKLPLILYWYILVKRVVGNYSDIPLPVGICKLVECNFLFNNELKFATISVVLIASILYLFERNMKWVTLFIFLISVFVFTAEESNGVLNRNGMYSFVFFAQSAAYWFHYFRKKQTNLIQSRVQFSIQIVGFSYFLSGASKLLDSGLNWATDGHRITLQVLKSFYYNWATDGKVESVAKGEQIVKFIEENSSSLEVMLWVSLILELFAFTTAINIKYARFYGMALLIMHIGISITMDILIMSFVVPMVIILINPLGLLLHQSQNKIQTRINK